MSFTGQGIPKRILARLRGIPKDFWNWVAAFDVVPPVLIRTFNFGSLENGVLGYIQITNSALAAGAATIVINKSRTIVLPIAAQVTVLDALVEQIQVSRFNPLLAVNVTLIYEGWTFALLEEVGKT